MIVPDGAVAAARHAYSAHRFEAGLVGFHEVVHKYDLVGAYAHALTCCPCLAHGEWIQNYQGGLRMRPMQTMRLVEWDVPLSRRRPWGPFAWRYPDGAICYPLTGAAWVWHPEYEAALRIWGPASFKVHDAWSFVPSCDHRPWDQLLQLLPLRNQFPALKKMINSIPGKLAQSRPKPGPWFDPMTAGLVTAIVRARMLEALAAAGPHAIGCVADALWSTRPVSLEEGVKFGQSGIVARLKTEVGRPGSPDAPPPPGSWKHETHSDVLFVQPGLAFGDPTPGEPFGRSLASQGTPAEALRGLAPAFHEAWAADGLKASLEIPYRHFVGITEGVAANAFDLIGTWTGARHEVRFDPLRKRVDGGRAVPSGESYHMVTLPPGAPDPDYFWMTGEPPQKISKAWMSSPYWDADWGVVSTPIDDIWPTDHDELVP